MLTSRCQAFEADLEAKGTEIVRLHRALLERDQLAGAIKVVAAQNGLIDVADSLDVARVSGVGRRAGHLPLQRKFHLRGRPVSAALARIAVHGSTSSGLYRPDRAGAQRRGIGGRPLDGGLHRGSHGGLSTSIRLAVNKLMGTLASAQTREQIERGGH